MITVESLLGYPPFEFVWKQHQAGTEIDQTKFCSPAPSVTICNLVCPAAQFCVESSVSWGAVFVKENLDGVISEQGGSAQQNGLIPDVNEILWKESFQFKLWKG